MKQIDKKNELARKKLEEADKIDTWLTGTILLGLTKIGLSAKLFWNWKKSIYKRNKK